MTVLMRRLFVYGLGLAIASVTTPAAAERAEFYNLEGFGSWLDGNPETTAVTEEGAIVLGPEIRERYEDTAASYSAAAPFGDEVLLARVDDAVILAVDRAGKERELFTPDETMVTALLAVGKDIYVAAGPPAKIYKVDTKGKSKVIFTPDAEYVWDMVMDERGLLYLATGAPGEVLRVNSKGKAETLFAPDQTHLRSLTYDKALGLFVGGGEKGIVYRGIKPSTIKALPKDPEDRRKRKEKDTNSPFRALYDSGHPEITAILVRNNLAYAAAVSGAAALAGDEGNEQQGSKRGKGPEVRSQLIQIGMDGTAETLAGSNDEGIFDLAFDDKGQVVVATGATGRSDPRGRLYAIQPAERQISMVYQSPSRRITQLIALPRDSLAAVAAGGGRVTHITGGYARKGEFLTVPFDATINSQWGALQIFGVFPKSSIVTAAVRTGQTKVPDESWSSWSKELRAPGLQSPKVPNGRYMQLRLTLSGNGKVTPEVLRVRLAFLRQNLPPFVREVVTLRKGLALLPIYQEAGKSKTVSLKDKAGADMRRADKKTKKPATGGGVRARQVEKSGALTVKWLAEDPNGDALRFDLMVRGSGDKGWREVENELEQPFYTFQSSQLPDGHYQFKVKATDAPSNPDGKELSDTGESRAILVDNTPPRVDAIKTTNEGGRTIARLVVADSVGALVEANYSLDGAAFRPMLPDDGVLDGPGESFTLRLGVLTAGSHSLTVRVLDEADNEGFGESVFTTR